MLEASGLSELEVTDGKDSIRLSRASSIAPVINAGPISVAAAQSNEPAVTETPSSDGHGVQSPTVGTFYSRSGPDADPFVKVGDEVSVGSTLCVVEAMKTFNEIQSDKAGKIINIFKGDGDPVEFGEVLFEIA